MFEVVLLVDILICLLIQNYDYAISSVSLFIGVLISRLFINRSLYDQAIVFLALVFYLIGFYHMYFLQDIIVCYFILLVAPIISSLLLENFTLKVGILVSSCLLFFLCNYISGISLVENYFFFYGLIPSSILMMRFHNKLKLMSEEKNALIQKLEEKNEQNLLFANMMSHDLKAPLRNIEGFSKLLQMKLKKLDNKEAELFSYITSSTETMKKLIDDLLEYSKSNIAEYSFKELDFEDLINNLIESFNYVISNSNIEINTSQLSSIHGHEESLNLVFQNLISNAIKYQPKDQGHIPKIEIIQKREASKNIITIKDNGIGFDCNKADEIFVPFKRFHASSDYEGTGLGMSIVNKVIEKHQGKIEVSSELGKGSTFTISLPANVQN